MPGRSYSSDKYRYSINGQEKSLEVGPNTTTALYWEYDSRTIRRWNVDPVPKTAVSPYVCLGSNPILYVDPLGNDWYKNKSTKNIEWFDGGESRKGYRKMRGDQNFRRRVEDQFGEKHWVDFSSDGTKSIWMEEVVLGSKSKKKGNSRMDLGYSYLNRSKEEIVEYQTAQTSYLRGRESGMPADPNLTVQGVNFERWYQGYTQGRQLSLGALGMILAPITIYAGAETGAFTYLFLSGPPNIKARLAVLAADGVYQIAKTHTWNPIQAVGSQFGPLSYALTSNNTSFDITTGNFSFTSIDPIKTIVSTGFNALGGHVINQFGAVGGNGKDLIPGGFLTLLPSVWGDGINEVIQKNK